MPINSNSLTQDRRKPRPEEDVATEASLLKQILAILKANFVEFANMTQLYLVKVGTKVEITAPVKEVRWNHFISAEEGYTVKPMEYTTVVHPVKNSTSICIDHFESKLNCKDFISFTDYNNQPMNHGCLLINRGKRISWLKRILKESTGPNPSRKRRADGNNSRPNKRRREEEGVLTMPQLLLPTLPSFSSANANVETHVDVDAIVAEPVSMKSQEENFVDYITSLPFVGIDVNEEDVTANWYSLLNAPFCGFGEGNANMFDDHLENLMDAPKEPFDGEWNFGELPLFDRMQMERIHMDSTNLEKNFHHNYL